MSNAKAANDIGRRLLTTSSGFRKAVDRTVGISGDTIRRTREKIQSNNKKIDQENQKQETIKKAVAEEMQRAEREGEIERKKPLNTSMFGKSIVQKPMQSFWKLLAAWAIDNLPKILKAVDIFVKKCRIFVASVNQTIRNVGTTFNKMIGIVDAVWKNIREFDFADQSGRIAAAKEELDLAAEDLKGSVQEGINVWNRDEADLDRILEDLENGKTLNETLKEMRLDNSGRPQPQSPAAGGGGGNNGAYVSGPGDPQTGSDKMKALLKTISFAEGTAGADGYNKWFGGRTDMDLSKMTINEVGAEMDRRNRTGENVYSGRASSAVGKYQMMHPEAAARAAGLNPAVDKFTPENQDKMVIAQYIKGQAGLTDAEIEGGITPAMIDKLAPVFASFPNLTPDNTARGHNPERYGYGTSYYGQGGKSKEAITDYYNNSLSAAPGQQPKGGMDAQTQTPVPAGASSDALTNKVTSSQFDTMDYGSSSPIIKTSLRGMRNGRHHGGIDFGTGGQRGWYCAYNANGKVTFVGYLSGYGKTVIIRFGNVELLFAHLARYGQGIRNGANYTGGSPIGEVGDTGVGSGIHLHLEARPPGGAGGSDIPVQKYVSGLVFGKLNPKPSTERTSLGRMSERMRTGTVQPQQRDADGKLISSIRTNNNRATRKTHVIKTTEVVLAA